MVMFDRTPPQDPEAERAVLGCCLLGRDGLDAVLETLNGGNGAHWFYVQAHALIFDSIRRMHRDGTPVDLRTVASALINSGEIEAAGGTSYVAELSDAVPTTANAEHYARIVRRAAVLREAILVGTRLAQGAYTQDADPGELLASIERELRTLADAGTQNGLVLAGDLINEAVSDLDAMIDTHGVCGLESGLADMDAITGGFKPGEMWIVAARPSCGKTALGLQIARHIAESGHASAFFSLEMSRRQLMARMLYAMSEITLSDIQNGRITRENCPVMLQPAIERWDKMRLLIDDTPSLTAPQIRAAIRRHVTRDKVSFAAVDYLQRVRADRRGDVREVEVASISRELKTAALESSVPVIALCQLNRQGDVEEPRLAHLRESGAIEQDADGVILLWTDAKDPRVTHAKIAKNRQGKIGTVHLLFDRDRQTFKPLAGGGFKAPVGKQMAAYWDGDTYDDETF